MSADICPKAPGELAELRRSLGPDTEAAFQAFSKSVFSEGALSSKTKQLIAVAVAHVTQCPYCIAELRHSESVPGTGRALAIRYSHRWRRRGAARSCGSEMQCRVFAQHRQRHPLSDIPGPWSRRRSLSSAGRWRHLGNRSHRTGYRRRVRSRHVEQVRQARSITRRPQRSVCCGHRCRIARSHLRLTRIRAGVGEICRAFVPRSPG